MSATDLAAVVVVTLGYVASVVLIVGRMDRSVRRVERAVGRVEWQVDSLNSYNDPNRTEQEEHDQTA